MIDKLKLQEDGSFLDEDNCTWDTKLDYLMMSVLPSCGCGNPKSIGRYVRGMLLKYVGQTGATKHICWELTDYEDLPVMFFLSWADREGYIEHGTTIRCSWMTKKGDELLKDLNEVLNETQNKNGPFINLYTNKDIIIMEQQIEAYRKLVDGGPCGMMEKTGEVANGCGVIFSIEHCKGCEFFPTSLGIRRVF
jgi:hypothetical protein